ncbi:MAG: hypothetical protein HC824_06905 [Synechococcales cyanobacterium RM1_1_8]|nr:hypothetical protein [Synechococcales cyanobacterium RU_4_20]NJN30187.1 hypothetical protein [Synechococcales cyanobacterium RM1_1_8]NJR70884.1 hypothetical protein [Synechococcales cyanobacterium CRU_2_2]
MTLAQLPELKEISAIQARTQAKLAENAQTIEATNLTIQELKQAEEVGETASPKPGNSPRSFPWVIALVAAAVGLGVGVALSEWAF